MADLVVLIPSRGRPEAARALVEHFKRTCAADTFLAFVVDEDDETREGYESIGDGVASGVLFTPSRTMVEAVNLAAAMFAGQGVFAVGFLGDDHQPRTVGWDEKYLAALREMGTGIVFGNDLLQGHRLPTQCAMTSDMIRALGYMAPPSLKHLYVDNTWLVWGNSLGRLRYLKDVIVEHRHPLAGKAAWDENYLRVNSDAVSEHDRLAFEEYMRDGLEADLAKIRAVMAVPA